MSEALVYFVTGDPVLKRPAWKARAYIDLLKWEHRGPARVTIPANPKFFRTFVLANLCIHTMPYNNTPIVPPTEYTGTVSLPRM